MCNRIPRFGRDIVEWSWKRSAIEIVGGEMIGGRGAVGQVHFGMPVEFQSPLDS